MSRLAPTVRGVTGVPGDRPAAFVREFCGSWFDQDPFTRPLVWWGVGDIHGQEGGAQWQLRECST